MLAPGTVVAINWGLFERVGLVADEGTIIHSSKKNGKVAEEPIAFILHSAQMRVRGVLDWASLQRAKAVGRSKLGQRWTLLNNCEHFISEICSGVRESPQLQAWAMLIGTGAALWVMAKYAR